MSKGFIQIDREMLNDPLYNEGKFDHIRALLDLLFLASYKERTIAIRGNKVKVGKGQVAESEESLARRWQWSRNTVRKFLSALENDGIIEQQKSRLITLITIKKYLIIEQQNEQQNEHQIAQQNEQQNEQPYNNINNNINKENKENFSTESVAKKFADIEKNFSEKISALEESYENKLKELQDQLSTKSSRKTKTNSSGENSVANSSLAKMAKEVICEFFKESFGEPMYWSGKEAGLTTQLLNKIKFSLKQKELSDSDEDIINALRTFLKNSIDDEWIKNNFSLTLLNTKYNDIVVSRKGKLSGMKVGVIITDDLSENFKDEKGW